MKPTIFAVLLASELGTCLVADTRSISSKLLPRQAAEPSPSCTISFTAPSLAPSKIGYPDQSASDGIHDTAPNATISSSSSTIFTYTASSSFISSNKAKKCALQFRLPTCSHLADDYPCYTFSGIEQEQMSKSGMSFSVVQHSKGSSSSQQQIQGWNDTMVHQVFPGDRKVIGTFDCADLVAKDADQKPAAVAWHVLSVRDFKLAFLQAGMGNRPKFMDGVGVWVLPCS